MDDYSVVPRARVDQLGEGPMWSARDGLLYWVDILGAHLHALEPDTNVVRSHAMPDMVCWAVERRDHADLLVGLRKSIARFDPQTSRTELVCPVEPDRPHNRLNDAKVDAEGNLWFGSKDDRDLEASGALYRMTEDGSVAMVDDGYKVTNGPAFSPDGRWLYHNDSGRGVVYRFERLEDEGIGEREEWIRFATEDGYPDGMTVDCEGGLWIAHWAGGRVSRFDPAGKLMRSVQLPASNITSCAFAGPNLDRMFVTSAEFGSPGSPDDGALFEIEPGVRGLPTPAYAG
ncbi:SMP-30/gluconolactonase/LRE family protein [Erythrobacter sp. 3-20A1M]|uniref:SMP-30/gluconolactonase/LRE family protein n=1 Tax=Erythrobacter sp. 3-20A1M TaxID=2653850 RepID=UPI001BFC1079|nr:SMP-30/gluconolactonase/LRE family protein [Erythrobacter sp. 3-20A1M]QWC58433.1 SMP-30/gluconolactonase/LRE family protein [Erythrobacter sp. 3-20A1M]